MPYHTMIVFSTALILAVAILGSELINFFALTMRS